MTVPPVGCTHNDVTGPSWKGNPCTGDHQCLGGLPSQKHVPIPASSGSTRQSSDSTAADCAGNMRYSRSSRHDAQRQLA